MIVLREFSAVSWNKPDLFLILNNRFTILNKNYFVICE